MPDRTIIATPGGGYPHGFPLTRREQQILKMLADGLTDAEVAERTSLSSRTISSHIISICTKLGVGTRAEAIKYASDRNLF